MGVVFSPPVMSRMLAFCTLASLLVLLCAAVAQAVDPYSITGRMLPMYTCLRILLLAPLLVPVSFFMRDIHRVALFSISCMWGFQVIFLVKYDTKVGWRVILWNLLVVYGQFDVFRSVGEGEACSYCFQTVDGYAPVFHPF